MVGIRKNLPQDFHAFLSWEVTLVAHRQFETLLVPGLLQTAEYARALVTGVHPDLTEVGAPLVMRNQLRRLAEAADAPHITIQILPKSVRASPALEGPFSILTLPDPIPDVRYPEGPGFAVYIEDRDAVRAYTLRFGMLIQQSLHQADSVKLITVAARGYE